MYEIQLFSNPEFGNIRAVDVDGETYFVGKDIAEALGYSNTSKALADHVDSVDKLNNTALSSLGQRGGWLINESGLYSLVLSSKLSQAKKFKHWVTSEVLPSIRKHGAYMTDKTIAELVENPDLVIELATKLKEEKAKLREEQERNAQLTEQNEELNIKTIQQEQEIGYLRPAAEYTNRVLSATDLITVTQIAKDYGVGAQTLNQWLHEEKIQYKSNGQWVLHYPYQNKGYTQSVTTDYVRSDGTTGAAMQTKWTQKGREFIYQILKKRRGIVPIRELRNNKLFPLF